MVRYIFAQPLIGGMPIGFEKEFGRPPIAIITAGYTNDEHYIEYMNSCRKLNVPIINMNEDYETFKSQNDEILYKTYVKNVDILAHVAVCSGLSQMNTCLFGSKARGCANNDQNQNMYNLTKLGMRMKAKVVVFENAVAAYTKSGEETVSYLKNIADSFKYSMQLIKTDTLLHGIPQSRKRSFILFYKDNNPPVFKFEHKKYKELGKYLEEIPTSSDHNDIYVEQPSSVLTGLYEFVLEKTNSKNLLEAINKIDKTNKNTWTVAQLTELIGWDDAILYFENRISDETDDAIKTNLIKILSNIKHYKNKKEMKKSYWDNTVILANRGKFTNAIVGKSLPSMINPTNEKPYTIREFIHLMGMPHDFNMINPKKNWNHICQNVPSKTAQYIASQIKLYLDEKLEIYNSNFLKQNNISMSIDTKEQIMSEW